MRFCNYLLLVVVLGAPARVSAQDDQDADLVGADESGGLMDEFAFLEEEMLADEVRSASKHRQSIFWSPSAITVFTREQIRASGAVNVPDLLRRVAGFDVYEIKPGIPLVGARGLTDDNNNRILLLIDGREDMMEITGYPIWGALAVGLDDIERMEVIRGPGSALYGANAFAGVVNIVTVSEKTPTGGEFQLAGGDLGYYLLSGNASGSTPLVGGKLSWGVSLDSFQRFGAATQTVESGVQVRARSKAFLRYQKGDQLDLSLHAGFYHGSGVVYIIIGDILADDLTSHHAMAKGRIALGESIQFRFQIYQNRVFSWLRPRSRIWALDQWVANMPPMDYDSNSFDGQAQLDLQLTDDLLVMAGCNLRYTWLEIDTFVDPVTDEVRGAVFLQAEWRPWETLQLTGGLRLDANSMTEIGLSPRLALVFQPREEQAFRLSYGLAFRKPTMLELVTGIRVEEFNPSMPEIEDKLAEAMGNRDLANERVQSLEAGYRGRFFQGQLDASLELYANIYADTIRLNTELALSPLGVPDISNSVIRYENLKDQILALGGEAALGWNLSADWKAWGNLGVRRVTWLKSGDELASEPSFRANLGFGWLPEKGILLDLAAHYVSSYSPTLVSPKGIMEEKLTSDLGDRWLLVSRLGYRWSTSSGTSLEAGLTLRAPLGTPFREYTGIRYSHHLAEDARSDFGGEFLKRLASFYLQGMF